MRALTLLALLTFPLAAGDLDTFLKDLNIQARLDPGGFSARIASQFQIGNADVQVVLSTVKDPADAFMVYQLSRLSQLPPDQVLRVYKTHGKEGWGAMAKRLGIKPGSEAFHALKRGEFRLEDHPGHGRGKKPGKAKHGKHRKD